MEPKPKAKQNARRKGCGKAAPWKSPNNGLFHLAWKSANPADFHFPTAPAATVIYLLFERLETKNKTRPRQRLTYPKQKMALTMGSTLKGFSRPSLPPPPAFPKLKNDRLISGGLAQTVSHRSPIDLFSIDQLLRAGEKLSVMLFVRLFATASLLSLEQRPATLQSQTFARQKARAEQCNSAEPFPIAG